MHRRGFTSCCLPRAGGCPRGSCIQPLQKWASATYPEQVHCCGWLGTQRRLSSGQVQAYQQIASSREQHLEAAQWQSKNFLATIFKSTFTSLFSTCRAQINQKHQPVVAKGNYCFVAFLMPVASEIIFYSSTSLHRKSPPSSSAFDPVSILPCCLWWTFDLDSAWSILQCFFRSCFTVGKWAWTVMGTQAIR